MCGECPTCGPCPDAPMGGPGFLAQLLGAGPPWIGGPGTESDLAKAARRRAQEERAGVSGLLAALFGPE